MTWKNKSEEGVTEENRQSQQRNLDADSNYKDLRPLEKSQYGLGRYQSFSANFLKCNNVMT